MKKKDIHKYDDIIEHAHPVSKKHPQMLNINRAAQFAPFAALPGHKEAVCETHRITEDKKIIDENKKVLLDEVLQEITCLIKSHPKIQVTYFQPDARKDGGAYLTIMKPLKRIDDTYQLLIFEDHTKIAIQDISEIEICR